MDDEIIYSWCFHDVECFDSTPSAAIIILDKDLESFSSLRSQQAPPISSAPDTDLLSPSTVSSPSPEVAPQALLDDLHLPIALHKGTRACT